MTNADGYRCGLHYDRKSCTCNYHCTGCRHAYGSREADCCTCCERAVTS